MTMRTLTVGAVLALTALASACSSASLSEPTTNDLTSAASVQARASKKTPPHAAVSKKHSGYLVAAGDR